MKMIFVIAGVSAFLAVALGAIGAHAFKSILDQTGKMAQYQTATEYHWYHTLALIAIGIMGLYFQRSEYTYAAYTIFVGIILFSGSLYVYALTQIKALAMITPIGGFAFLIGWGIFVLGVMKSTFQ